MLKVPNPSHLCALNVLLKEKKNPTEFGQYFNSVFVKLTSRWLKLSVHKRRCLDNDHKYKCLKGVYCRAVGRRWKMIRERGRIQARSLKSFSGNFIVGGTAGTLE